MGLQRRIPRSGGGGERSASDPGVDVFAQLIKFDFLCASSVMLRRSLFDERGLLDPSAVPADDYEMWLRCMPEAKLGFLGEPLIEWVMHAGNYSHNERLMTEQTIRVLQRHRKRHAATPARRHFDESLPTSSCLYEKLATAHSRTDARAATPAPENGPAHFAWYSLRPGRGSWRAPGIRRVTAWDFSTKPDRRDAPCGSSSCPCPQLHAARGSSGVERGWYHSLPGLP